jgi:GNAT superfamily N-acetyltransferase
MVGMIGVHIFNHPMSGEKIGCEAFWWVEPEARGGGLGLLKRGEAWLKAMGAKRIQMIAPNERVARLYRRRGYSKTEEHYQKDAR